MRARIGWRACLTLGTAVLIAAGQAQLYGIKWDNGALYKINPTNAAVTKVGDTNITGMADIQFGPDGFLYGFTTGLNAKVYKINPANANTTAGPSLGLPAGTFVFEGAMAYDSGWKFWCAASQDAGHARLFKLDVSNGNVSDAFTLLGDFDINGWAFPDIELDTHDVLQAMDRESGRIQNINLNDHSVDPGIVFPGDFGEVGGMTTDGVFQYIATGGPGSIIPGSNKLYIRSLLDPPQAWFEQGTFTGIDGWGFSGLAAVPEPSSLLALAGVLFFVRRRKAK